MNDKRYARQVILPEIGKDGQEKLARASVLCVGAGGLGCPALLYLAAAGIGRIGIIDFDAVEESNLQRQVLFGLADVGASKAVAAGEKLRALNPDITVEIYEGALDEASAPELFSAYDIILDGTDNFAAKFLMNDAAVKYGKPWVYGALLGFDGQVSLFDAASGGPCYRCLYPEVPGGNIPNCAQAGVIGALAGIIGTTQALQVIEYITGHESFESLIGKLFTLDGKTMQTRLLTLPKNPECAVCGAGHKREEIMLHYASPVCGFVPELSPTQAREMKDAVLIDVRERHEWEAGHIAEAQHWPLSRLMKGELPGLAPGLEIILHCQKGMRSLQAAQILKERGYLDVYSLSGGYEAWLEEAG